VLSNAAHCTHGLLGRVQSRTPPPASRLKRSMALLTFCTQAMCRKGEVHIDEKDCRLAGRAAASGASRDALVATRRFDRFEGT